MVFYRVAIQAISPQGWRWKSTILSSLDTLFHFLRLYQGSPQNHLRVFSSSFREGLNEQLIRENNGLESNSVTAARFLQERMLCVPETVNEVAGADQVVAFPALTTCTWLSESSNEANDLDKMGMSFIDMRRIELEFGVGGDHDCSYTFSLPISTSQVFSWRELLLRIQNGVLQP